MKNVIYKIRNIVNGKFYVGSTVDSRVRFQTHKRRLKKGTHQSPHLQAAWDKYGEDCFKFEIVEYVDDPEKLLAAEQVWLDAHAGKAYCYNWATDASAPMRGKKHTEEAKAKMTGMQPKGEAHYRFGKTLDEETRKKIGDAQRGVPKGPRVYTEEGLARAQENMRRNAREQKPTDFSAVLAKFPDEVRERYDFSSAVYTGALVRIEGCVCPDHGVFSQYAAQFRKGRGCPQCGQVQRSATRSQQMKEAWNDPEEREKMMEARKK
jgi:group I intron endonuclease